MIKWKAYSPDELEEAEQFPSLIHTIHRMSSSTTVAGISPTNPELTLA